MARRESWRIHLEKEVKVSCKGEICEGTVKNLSERGMFISIGNGSFPKGPELDIILSLNDSTLSIPVRLVRYERADNSNDGIGVELIDPPKQYKEFVDSLLYVV